MKDKIWLAKNSKFLIDRPDSRQYLLLKNIGKIIKKQKSKKILDFGCGEGYLSSYIPKDIELYLFDINESFVKIAMENATKNKINRVFSYTKIKELRENKFDLIVISLVLVTTTSKIEFKNIIQDCQSLLNKDGILIIAETHPCFRDKIFSTFHTEYTSNKTFSYIDNFSPFQVNLNTFIESKFIHFNDIHYTLGFLFETLEKLNFSIVSFKEIKDKPFKKGDFYNTNFPPYFILISKKIK